MRTMSPQLAGIHEMIAASRNMPLANYFRSIERAGFGRPPQRGYGKYRGRTPDYERKIPRTPADFERVEMAERRQVEKARRQAKGFVGYAASAVAQ